MLKKTPARNMSQGDHCPIDSGVFTQLCPGGFVEAPRYPENESRDVSQGIYGPPTRNPPGPHAMRKTVSCSTGMVFSPKHGFEHITTEGAAQGEKKTPLLTEASRICSDLYSPTWIKMSRRSSIIVERFRVLGAVGLCFVTGFMIAYFVLPTQKPLYTLLKSTSVASQSSDVQKQSDACIHRLVCEIHASKNPKDVEKLGKAARHFQRFFRYQPLAFHQSSENVQHAKETEYPVFEQMLGGQVFLANLRREVIRNWQRGGGKGWGLTRFRLIFSSLPFVSDGVTTTTTQH
ncbi:unnamed protein product [Cyprideis torosa]|uniref:Uncharacterized protein n=1 Tax=Cyprideis torosa TaxID=163714 RepID=A0A7R8ZK49_9CRUS|nr:unnamed protein product [Cyprideis torosa]CAG0880997.1 unnamed protein product [Cyprideis torosa]